MYVLYSYRSFKHPYIIYVLVKFYEDGTLLFKCMRVFIYRKLKFLPSKMPIRDGFLYNNYMYMLLGHVTEILGKDTWENLVISKIIRPLGMNSTRILKVPDDIMEADIAKPYIYTNDTFQNGTQEIYE